jgi:hypothetical protein
MPFAAIAAVSRSTVSETESELSFVMILALTTLET